MGGVPLISSNLYQSGTRDELRQPFVFGTNCSSSVESEAKPIRVTNHHENDTVKDEKISEKLLKCYKENMKKKYVKLRKKLVKKKQTFLQRHKEFDSRSSKTKNYRTSVILEILKSFKWNQETTDDVKKSIKHNRGCTKRFNDS